MSYQGAHICRWPYSENTNWDKTCERSSSQINCAEWLRWAQCKSGIAKSTQVFPLAGQTFKMGGCFYDHFRVYECSSEGRIVKFLL